MHGALNNEGREKRDVGPDCFVCANSGCVVVEIACQAEIFKGAWLRFSSGNLRAFDDGYSVGAYASLGCANSGGVVVEIACQAEIFKGAWLRFFSGNLLSF